MYIHEIEQKWGANLSAISNQGKMTQRFDFTSVMPYYWYNYWQNCEGLCCVRADSDSKNPTKCPF